MKLISSFSIPILLFLFLAKFQETNAKGLISKACESSIHKDLCKATLKADPSCKRASMDALANIALKAALENGTAMQNEIETLLKSRSGTTLESALKDCKENFKNAVSQLKNSKQAIENKRYNDVNTWVTAAMNDAESCDEGFKDADKQSPIYKMNTVFGQLCSNVLAITNKAAAATTDSSAQGGQAAQGAQGVGGQGAQVGQDYTKQGKSAGSIGKGNNVRAPDLKGPITLEHARIALKAALEGAETASNEIVELHSTRAGTSFESALKDCKENYKNVLSQLKRSLEALENQRYNDVNAWVTAAMNDAESCEDGFKDEGKDSLTISISIDLGKLCSSVLAITNKLAASKADSDYTSQAGKVHHETVVTGSTVKQHPPSHGSLTDYQAKTALKAALVPIRYRKKSINWRHPKQERL
ncbi:uncharacterized protein LOC107411836 [Ziziphus jujuba]|uniref:Uncharacterized protein LOC107411836 n=1 Tax=Ziziphus jujuba TaxID=326968 RepID=A0A6P3ZN23_ZIZJJ|nr:uncharacterized protein LOC107411836 [Ziziphus jujuba]